MRLHVAGLFALFLASAPAFATNWETGSFRTAGGGLIQRGDNMTEVLTAAGEPLQRRVISVGISIGAIAGLTREQWTYRGYDGVYVLTFVGDEVLLIRVIPFR